MNSTKALHPLATLLTANGYDLAAVEIFLSAPLGDSPAMARERIRAVTHNYYMQYLAIQLDRFGFQLNRPHLKPKDLQQAEHLIMGKRGNEPLDNMRLAELMRSLANDMLAQFNREKLTWGDFYLYEFTTQDGITLRAEEMIKALIRSNQLHLYAYTSTYHHTFGDIEYATLSMHHLMARVLTTEQARLPGINAFGIRIKQEDITRVRNVANRITSMRDPQLMGFFQQNAHHNIRQKLMEAFKALHQEPADLPRIHRLETQLMRDNFSPEMYSREWQSLLQEMHIGLQWIATPYH